METLKIYGFLSQPSPLLLILRLRTHTTLMAQILSSICSSRDTTGLHLQFLLPALHPRASCGGLAWPPFFPTSHRSLSFAACCVTSWKPFFPMFCLDFSCFRQESKSRHCYSILARCKNLFCLLSSFILQAIMLHILSCVWLHWLSIMPDPSMLLHVSVVSFLFLKLHFVL